MSAGLTEGNSTDTASGSGSALNADLVASLDVNDYQSCNFQITGTFVATLKVQGSNDGTNFKDTVVLDASDPSSPPTTSITAAGLFYTPTPYRYFRLRITAYTSGTATAVAFFQRLIPGDLGARISTLRGATDGTAIGNVGSRLMVDANFSVLGGQLVPTITNKLRIRYSTASAVAGSAYSTVYTRSGTGLFFGFQADFNSANVRLRLTIDSGQIFEITLVDVKAFQFNDTSTTRMQMGGFWTTVGNTLDFSTKYAIPYTSSVLIEMQRSDGTNHTMNQYMVFLTEDT